MAKPTHVLVVTNPHKPATSLTPAKVAAAVQVPPDAPATWQRIYWVQGNGMPLGLGLLVRTPNETYRGLNATWVVQADDPRGVGTRLKIARYGDMPVDQVLERARELRERIQAGTHRERRREAQVTAARNSYTVGDAFRVWAEHLVQHRRPSVVTNALGKDGTPDAITAGTLKSGYILKHFGDWLRKPLADLDETALRDRHARITRDGGASIANRAMKALRAAWSRARALNKQLPPNLLRGGEVERGWAWNEEREGGAVIDPKDLPEWWAEVHRLPPVRRDWNLVALFTAARRDDVKRLRWEHIDLERGTVHFPCPKGGPKKAYTIPVCAFVVELLRRRRAENRLQFGDDGGWVFPIRHPAEGVTHIRQPAEYRYVDGKKTRALPSPHALRRTWITAADGRVPTKVAERLSNHVMDRGMNISHRRYQVPDEDALRAAAEVVAEYLLEKAGAAATIRALSARA